MTGETTSLVHANSARAEWRDWLAFLRRPHLPDRPAGIADAAMGTVRMLGLDMIIMAVLIAGLVILVASGFELPNNALNDLTLGASTIALIVIVAPLVEEIAFRSWLSGRPGHVIALLLVVGGGVAAALLAETNTGDAASSAVLAVSVGVLVLAGLALFLLRKRPPMRWFQAIFPGFFWLSTLGFALIHLANYTEGALAILLPMVLPQFILGSMLGYVRVHYGLWAAIALHMTHNGLIVGLVMQGVGQAG